MNWTKQWTHTRVEKKKKTQQNTTTNEQARKQNLLIQCVGMNMTNDDTDLGDWMNGEVPSCPSKSLTAPMSFINNKHNSHVVLDLHDQDPGPVVFLSKTLTHFDQTVNISLHMNEMKRNTYLSPPPQKKILVKYMVS